MTSLKDDTINQLVLLKGDGGNTGCVRGGGAAL